MLYHQIVCSIRRGHLCCSNQHHSKEGPLQCLHTSKIDPLFTLFLNSFFGEYFVNDTSSMELFFTFVFTKVAGGGNKFLKNNGKVQSTSRRQEGTKAKFELA
jgi:hypothetical protein